ncbi:tetratricopeptide repeat protein [Candidatus Giovannonibacteria bacterium]|nr:tetratricopeptide repeat protein [Candidatus Giovannonibacteria bacterium]
MADGFREQVAYVTGLGSKASEWLLYSLIFVFSFFALPLTILPVDLNKSYLIYFGLLLAGIIYLISTLQSGKVKIPKTIAGIFLFAFLACLAVSSLLSVSPHVSFLGLGSESGTLSAIGIFISALIIGFLVFDAEEKVFRAFLALFGSFAVLAIFQIFQTILRVPPIALFGKDLVFNLFGSWNELGIFSGLILLLSSIFLEYVPKSYVKVALWFVFALSLVISILVNFSFVWWVLTVILTIFLAYHYSRKRNSESIFRVSFAVLIFSLIMIFSGGIVTDLLENFGITFLEARPNLEFTMITASKSLGGNAAFGYGPNTFTYAWFNFRPSDILSTPFWQTRFNAGFGFIPTLLVTSGLIGLLALLAFLGMFLYYGFKSLIKSSAASSFLILATFGGALYLWIFSFIYPGSFSLIFPMFLLTGLFVGLAMEKGVIEEYEIFIFERSGAGFIGALVLILLIVLGASWFSIMAQKYYAAILFGEGNKALAAGNLEKTEDLYRRALKFDKRDAYLRSFTDLGMLKLQQIVGSGGNPDEIRIKFQNALTQTIQNADEAVKLNPADGLNWINLGRVFESVMPFQIQGVVERAQDSYVKAAEKSPTSPDVFLASARVEILKNDLPRARDFLKKAIGLKNDYAQAHFLLAQLEATTGNIDLAIKSAETTAFLQPNDIGVLFQLGLLYYQENKLNESRFVFERAVSIAPNYSNARYFLGLIYYKQGDKPKALDEFKKIGELNPNNSEVRRIVANLSEGKEPLAGISPPGPLPEKRKGAPIEQ